MKNYFKVNSFATKTPAFAIGVGYICKLIGAV